MKTVIETTEDGCALPDFLCINFDPHGTPHIVDTSDGNCHVGISYALAVNVIPKYTVLADIDLERERQISKGYNSDHDDRDVKGNHARAAAYYAAAGYAQRSMQVQADDAELFANAVSSGYPWPEDTKAVEASPRENLVKAAALLIAEIERIDREEASQTGY